MLLVFTAFALGLLLIVNSLHSPAPLVASPEPAAQPSAAPEPVASIAADPAPTAPPSAAVPAPAAAPYRPASVSVPSLGIVAPVQPVGTSKDGQMEIPVDPAVAGWWEGSALIGDPDGNTVLAGHVFNKEWGPGIFSRLAGAKAGDAVEMSSSDGATSRYIVNDVLRVPKAEFPIGRVFALDGPHQLVLATCGNYNAAAQHYEDNILVFAAPAT